MRAPSCMVGNCALAACRWQASWGCIKLVPMAAAPALSLS